MLSTRVRTPRAPWQGGAGMSPGEWSVLRQAWPQCSFPHSACFLIHWKNWVQTHLGKEGQDIHQPGDR